MAGCCDGCFAGFSKAPTVPPPGVGEASTLIFKTDYDRPGLLHDITQIVNKYGVDIRAADISTNECNGGAAHAFQVVDAETKGCLTPERLADLQAQFDRAAAMLKEKGMKAAASQYVDPKFASTVTFKTNFDRPGLLGEVTNILKSHGVDIRAAEISTDPSSGTAVHVYKVVDGVSKKCLSPEKLTTLKAKLEAQTAENEKWRRSESPKGGPSSPHFQTISLG
eukprot:gnl/TRDRNA2_/TRDRNA2_201004_c0_seq1.p1 gnl/TRDRNA2_/TRDRNA2_201004_c0~~gnl/TRDRNA2_/TRDRNA2_201004_c0_seq1.p1  ORF type:complete len:223 (-),score=41.31 gnl/TRDRNA2_/TRDRNA2_201004_c0_seq1:70-738(-)